METKRIENREERVRLQPREENLKGTLTSVLIVGAFILVVWFAMFGLFLQRG
jgi:hypothetical protein